MGSDDIEADPIPSTKYCFRTHDQPPPKTFQWKRTKHLQKQYDNDNNADITKSESKTNHGNFNDGIEDADNSQYIVHQLSPKNEARESNGSDDTEAEAVQNGAGGFKSLPTKLECDDNNADITKCEAKQVRGNFNDDTEDADNSHYIVHQLNPKNEARESIGSGDTEAEALQNGAGGPKCLFTKPRSQSVSPNNFMATSMMSLKMLTIPITVGTSLIPRMKSFTKTNKLSKKYIKKMLRETWSRVQSGTEHVTNA